MKEKKADFEPSMRILSRILRVILERDSLGRTALSQQANVNYVTLSKHLGWLETKSIIHYIVNDGKVIIKLNQDERNFALKMCGFIN